MHVWIDLGMHLEMECILINCLRIAQQGGMHCWQMRCRTQTGQKWNAFSTNEECSQVRS